VLDIPGAYRRYCRVASVVFLLFTVYPVVTKLLEHRLAHDWAHSALHLASALLAAYAGWVGRPAIARLYVLGIGLAYTALFGYGLSSDGLFLGTIFAIPLGPVDNVFHLVLAVPALAIVVADVRRRRLVRPR
jgi:hypothetical protein